jgi:hypothetical protein
MTWFTSRRASNDLGPQTVVADLLEIPLQLSQQDLGRNLGDLGNRLSHRG